MSDEDIYSSDDDFPDFGIPYEYDSDLIYDEDNETITPAAVNKLFQAVNQGSDSTSLIKEMVSTEDLLEADAELTLLQLKCSAIKVKEIEYYRNIVNFAQSERGSHILQSQKVAIEFAAAANPADGNFWLRRLYSTVTSSKFCKAIHDRDVAAAMEFITQELLLYIGVQQTLVVLKKYWTVVLEALEAFLKKNIGVANSAKIAIGIIMMLAGLVISTRDRKSWDQVPFDTIREILKVTVVLMTTFWVSIPACKFIDDACDAYRYQVFRGKSYVGSIGPALWTAVQKISFLGPWLAPPIKVNPADLCVDQYCHTEFICPITLGILEDPVALHGTFFSRALITEWVRARGSHPFSKRRAVADQITEPSDEYMEIYAMYVARRAHLLKEAGV